MTRVLRRFIPTASAGIPVWVVPPFRCRGHPHVAYTNGKSYADLMYVKNAGTGWDITKVDDGGGMTKSTGLTPSLALDSRGIPAYQLL